MKKEDFFTRFNRLPPIVLIVLYPPIIALGLAVYCTVSTFCVVCWLFTRDDLGFFTGDDTYEDIDTRFQRQHTRYRESLHPKEPTQEERLLAEAEKEVEEICQ